MSKNYFGLLDSRNTKYQGLIHNDSFNGIGIILDHLFTLSISTWQNSNLNGPSFTIFPNQQILFGQMLNNKPIGITCFQLNSSQKITLDYTNISNKNKSQHISIAYILASQSIVQMQYNFSSNQIKLGETFYPKNNQEELKVLTNIFKTDIQNHHIQMTSYLSKYFIQSSNSFQLSGKNQLFFGFKGTSSLGFKFENNNLTSIGYFNNFPRNLIFGKKIHYNIAFPSKTQIQQGHFQSPFKTFIRLKEKNSSIECIKFTEQYFKKSTTFRNQFTKIDHLQKLHNEIIILCDKIKIETSKRFGQALLENDYGSSHDNDKQVVIKQYTLEQIKQQIYKAAAKKQNNVRNMYKSPFKQSVRTGYNNDEYIDIIGSNRRYIESYKKSQQLKAKIKDQQVLNRSNIIVNNNNILNKQISYLNKDYLIRNVNKIIQKQKQYQNALIKQLINQNQIQSAILKSNQYIANDNYYQPLSSNNRKYHRYQPQTSPFLINSNQINSQLIIQPNSKRKFNYIYQENRQINSSTRRSKSPYQILRKDKSLTAINNFQLHQDKQSNKSHINFSKYKQRRKQRTPSKITNNDSQNRYQYFIQNQQDYQGNHKINKNKNKQNQTQQIKLFQVNNFKNKRNQTQTNNQQQNYKNQEFTKNIQLQINQKDNIMKDRLNDKLNERINDKLNDRTNKIQNQVRYDNKRSNTNKQSVANVDKYYERRKVVGSQNNQSLRRDITNKKLKRTFHYID